LEVTTLTEQRFRGLRIHVENLPLLELPETHPALQALVIQARSRDICVGKEIDWPDATEEAIDQEWYSLIDKRKWNFSGFAYCFISFDLILGGWLSAQDNLQPFEQDFLCELPRLRGLLSECKVAANADGNDRVAPMVAQAFKFLDAYEQSIIARVGPVKVEPHGRFIESLWGAGKIKEGG